MRRWRRLPAVLVGCLALVALAAGTWLLWDLPDPAGIMAAAPAPSTLLYDRRGELLYEALPVGSGRSRPLPLAEFPPYLIKATIATEDAAFYQHPGIDLVGIVRAAYYSLRSGRVVAGGSTITQQVARNLLLPEVRFERTLHRKLREAVLSLLIEARYDKDEILELYLNSTFYGRQSYGAEAAARSFFGKPLRALDLSECAFLAGLPQSPYTYAPELGDAWVPRRQVVLGLMGRQGFISADEAEVAARETLTFVTPQHGIRAPHFVAYVLEAAERALGTERVAAGGLRIYTTLDLAAQQTAMRVVTATLETLNRDPLLRVDNAAVLACDLADGAIRVMIGSPDYFDDRISGAVNSVLARRQPGSAVKPITYAAAFEAGYTPATMMLDVPTSFTTAEGEAYQPINYDYSYRGPVLLREALGSSYNVVAVRLLDAIGVPAFRDMAGHLGVEGIARAERLGLAATLGGTEVTLLELTRAYSVFGREGLYLDVRAMERVTDEDGGVLWEGRTPETRRAISATVAYLLTDVLSDDRARVPTFGEGSVLNLSRPAAVKTGTTTDCRDNWTIGYTPQMVVGVWTGNANGGSMGPVSGVEGAAPIWNGVMEALHRGLPREEFAEPEGLVRAEVCALSGLAPQPFCPHRLQEAFIAGTEPSRSCDLHRQVPVEAGIAGAGSSRVVTVLPAEAQAWSDERGVARTPRTSATSEPEPLRLTRPAAGQAFRLAPDLPRDSQATTVAAGVSADLEVEVVRLLVDGELLAELARPPFRTVWRLVEGEHRFQAEAVAGGRTYRSQVVTVTVK